jgi:hypothetical protein
LRAAKLEVEHEGKSNKDEKVNLSLKPSMLEEEE